MSEVKKKKKRRRYKIVWPWNNPKLKQEAQQTTKKKHRRLKLRKEVYYVLFAIFVLLLLIFVPKWMENNKLKKLGYTKEEVAAIREQKLTRTLLDKQYYSPFLAKSIVEGTLNTDYLSLYTVISEDGSLTDLDFLLYNRLLDKGYEEDQLLELFKSLYFYEMTPLLVFDYQPNEFRYIDDCLNHRDTNSKTHFQLSGEYFKPYAQPLPVDDPTNINMLVNKTYYLESNFKPKNLTDLSTYYSAEDNQLSSEAANALAEWGDAGRNVGVTFFATSAYRPYEDQEVLYKNYVTSWGEAEADSLSARAGFSEHQTGLTVDIAATNEDDIEEFKDTKAYRWTSTNSQDYGWILRYPEGKEQITGYQFESWHYRYLGKELAKAVYASQMTYDEFYCLYLKPWYDEANKPSDTILANTNYQKKEVKEETTQEAPEETTDTEKKG